MAASVDGANGEEESGRVPTRRAWRPAPPRTGFSVACKILWGLAIVSGGVLIARAFAGPFELGLSVRSPLNAQGIFGSAAALLVLLRSRAGREPPDVTGEQPDLAHCVALVGVVLAASICFGPSLTQPFLSDEYVLISQGQSFSAPYVGRLFTQPGGDGFYRPVGLAWITVWAYWTGDWLPRLAGLLPHLANVALIFLLAVGLRLRPWPALAGAALFALHGSRPEAVIWLAASFDTLATFFLLAALLLYMRACGRQSRGLLAASALLLLAGLWTKEVAYCFPILAALAVPLRYGSAWTRKAWLLVTAVAITAFVHRWWMLGGIGGYVDPSSGAPEALTFGWLGAAKVLALRLWSALFFPVNWSLEPGWLLGLGMALGIAGFVGLTFARAPRPLALTTLGMTVAAALPALHQLLIGADLEKARLLYLPSVGFCLFLAVTANASKTSWTAPVAAFFALALFHNLAIWREVAALAPGPCAEVHRAIERARPEQVVVRGLPGSINGVYYFRNGFHQCVAALTSWQAPETDLAVLPANADFARKDSQLVFDWDPEDRRLVLHDEPPIIPR